jgi:hypothetical protein
LQKTLREKHKLTFTHYVSFIGEMYKKSIHFALVRVTFVSMIDHDSQRTNDKTRFGAEQLFQQSLR